MPENEVSQKIEYVGLAEAEIDSFLEGEIKDIIARGMEKIRPVINKDISLKVHVKKQSGLKEEKKHKYIIMLHLRYPGNLISTDNAADWDVKSAAQIAIKEMEHRVTHIFKDSR